MKIHHCCKLSDIKKLIDIFDFRIALEIDGDHYAVREFHYKSVNIGKDMYDWEMILEKLDTNKKPVKKYRWADYRE